MDTGFSRLAPFIREYVYEKKWTALRDIQEAAIREIFDGDGHFLIAAGTASGKTEACFFPIISILYEAKLSSVGALYIGPLKALINDQAERLAPLMERAGLPLWRWHGDISGRHKKSLLENPSGILQITPESMEALLLRSPGMIRPLFHDLSFVIIDEVHAFMGTERGSQILCQLARIEEAARCRPRRAGLSATLGDYRGAMAWLKRGSGRLIRDDSAWDRAGGSAEAGGAVALIREKKNRRRVSAALDHFSRDRGEEGLCFETVYQQVRGKRCIIFTNSRIEAEETVAALGGISARYGGRDRFFIHHGSVSADLRFEAERELKDSPGPVTAAATATLEMGIDIGALDRVIQIGPPLSVSAFVQRLGRSGRLRGKPEIYFSIMEEKREHSPSLNSVEEAVMERDLDVIDVFDSLMKMWAMAVANISAVINPDVIILGGAVNKTNEVVLSRIKHYVSRIISYDVNIELGRTGEYQMHGGLSLLRDFVFNDIVPKALQC
jgi:ATP-dependent Lhr-like helicase